MNSSSDLSCAILRNVAASSLNVPRTASAVWSAVVR